VSNRLTSLEDFYNQCSRDPENRLGTSFVFTYALNLKNQSLQVGGWKGVSFNVTPPTVLPFLSPKFTVNAQIGEHDEETINRTNTPQLSKADAILLLPRPDTLRKWRADLDFRARWTENGTLELWSEFRNNEEDESLQPCMAPSLLLSLKNYTPTTRARFRAIIPADKASSSPSKTYHIRMWTLAVVGITGFILMIFWRLISLLPSVLGTLGYGYFVAWQWVGLYVFGVGWRWYGKGRPPLRQFLSTDWVTKYFYGKLASLLAPQPELEERQHTD
jgi:hypothetical protein